ncbi:transposase [Bacillus sp. T3]|uniref:transposase n=1 Tax=Bacillus sp. T3 TaxID=467262 RepID=UPI0029821FA2|nr:transposase [Bacillus sp. T3]
MSRKPREWYPGTACHITARGNRHAEIFHEEEDYIKYLEILEDVREKYPFTLHSYCLMTNHLHLQLETPENYIPEIIQKIHTIYAIYLNKKLDTDGHVFQGRYGSKIIISQRYFLIVNRYIHRNPLEAKMVQKAEDYPWSSYSAYLGLTENPLIDPTKTLSFFSSPTYQTYREFVEKEESDEEEEIL